MKKQNLEVNVGSYCFSAFLYFQDYSEVEDKETKQEGTIKGSVYYHYIMAGSGIITFVIFMFFNCTAQVFTSFVFNHLW